MKFNKPLPVWKQRVCYKAIMAPSPPTKDETIRQLETQIRHLQNELALTQTEYQNLINNYFDIFSNMEKMVEERTRELHLVKSQLETKTRELQIMLDASPTLIFYKDTGGRYIRANRRFSDFLNIPIRDIVGKTHLQLFPGSDEKVFLDDAEIIHSGQPVLGRTGHINTPEGRKPMLVDKIPNKGPLGEVIGIIGFATDMTDQENAQREKLALQERLARSQKMESIGLLAGGVAHDLNNVLTGFVSYPDYLLMEIPHDSPLRDPILTIQESGKKAAAIVQDLLTLARRGVTHTEVLNLNEIVTGYIVSPESQRLGAENSRVRLEMHLDGDLLNIKGSSVHLRKTIMNLVLNAFEAQPLEGRIVIRTFNRYVDRAIKGYDHVQEGDYVVLEILDEGVGIPAEELNRIFEPFYTRKVMGRSGTGLGMAVVWGTVQDHGGYINVESTPGKGSAFSLYFPATRETLSRREEPLPIEAYMGRGEHILVVDDVLEQREIATSLLGRLNYSVESVESGLKAVEYLRRQPADLVILDMIMDPGIDGLETYRRILGVRPHQRAIIASGYSENERVREAQRLGAGTYVRKPYLLEIIGMAVRRELDRPAPEYAAIPSVSCTPQP
jgi:signal transduction histidine kinase/ActR/RegA family two-component response regulator/phage pi2 protein 07